MRTLPLLSFFAFAPSSVAASPGAPTWLALPAVQVDPTCLGQHSERESPSPIGSNQLSAKPRGAAPSVSRSVGQDAVAAEGASSPAKRPRREASSRAPQADADRPFPPPTHPPGAIVHHKPGPAVTWGGTVHLSNDDAMSLASAQRVLWALEHDAPLPAAHIRPHELLNYFSFDTTSPRGNDLIGVGGAAFRDGDTLRLAVDVQAATPDRPPVDLTVLVDRSGSMRAEGRMSWAQRALRLATEQLDPGDRVDLVVFDHAVCAPVRDFVVGRDDPALIGEQIDALQPRGSTDLDAGLREAYRIAQSHLEQRRAMGRVMVFTDAILNTGQVNPDVVTEIGRALDRDKIRLTGVGVGRGFRDDVLDQLTEKGRGAYVFLGSEQVVDRLFGPGFDRLIHTVAEDVRFRIDLPDSLGMTRFYGEESSRDAADITPVMLAAGSHQVHFSDLAIRDGQLKPEDRVTFHASWKDPSTGAQAGTQQTWRVRELLARPERNVRKAAALMAWSDALLDRAMGGERCGESLRTFLDATAKVADDAELSWAAELTRKGCKDVAPAPPSVAALKLRIDADQPIGAVDLDCPQHRSRQTLRSGDQVATFAEGQGSCLVTLHGAVPLASRIEVAPQGTQATCRVRGGRITCQ